MIQSARCEPLLAAHGAKVSGQPYIELKPLMQTLERVEAAVAPRIHGRASNAD